MGGLPRFCELSRRLAFGADCPASAAGRVATVQTLSGTGALRVGGEFLKRHHGPGTIVYLPNPSWCAVCRDALRSMHRALLTLQQACARRRRVELTAD